MTNHRAYIYVPKNELRTINKFLTATLPEDFQGEDNTIVYTATFDNGFSADIKCCGCQDECSWTEMVLFDLCGCERTCTDVCDTFTGLWELPYGDDLYTVIVDSI